MREQVHNLKEALQEKDRECERVKQKLSDALAKIKALENTTTNPRNIIE